jgi:hypothetical protein
MGKIASYLRSTVGSRITSDVYGNAVLRQSLGKNWRQYWLQGKELFARAFEQYVAAKLSEKDRKNNYLSGVRAGSPLWPNDAETAAMKPMFDELFSLFRGSDHLRKSMMRILGA